MSDKAITEWGPEDDWTGQYVRRINTSYPTGRVIVDSGRAVTVGWDFDEEKLRVERQVWKSELRVVTEGKGPNGVPVHEVAVNSGLPPFSLQQWWLERAKSEVQPMVDKMREYGGAGRALDLEEIGRGLVQSGVQGPPEGVDESAWYSELGVYFYLLGKFARWTAAVAEGRKVSDDTLLDIGVYVRMAQRIRHTGGWPE